MRTLVFATLMCVAAMSAKAHVITSETINDVYENVSSKQNSDYFYNAEKTGNDITTVFVYKNNSFNGLETLSHHLKYEYTYAADGTLTSKVTYRWADSQSNWICADRYEYTIANGKYYAEYSRYNLATNSFDQPTEKMVYTLTSADSINNVSSYHRNSPFSTYKLDSETTISK